MGQRTSRPTEDLEIKQQILGLDEKDEQQRIRITALRDSRLAKRLQFVDIEEYHRRIFRKGDIENMDDGFGEIRAFHERRRREVTAFVWTSLLISVIGLSYNLWMISKYLIQTDWFRNLIGMKDPNAAISN
ncbi:hypothetical protein [Phaffia rhodozyma]|uniref:Uncharacterized protein n=1 Tax=Phaffia rhodozyma TaxID=264483 RepID=A0A0F7SEL1_PHARH|nr:hypothetical protein [Phaffia rhodozyma]